MTLLIIMGVVCYIWLDVKAKEANSSDPFRFTGRLRKK